MVDCLSPESLLSISAGCQAVIFGHFELFISENKRLKNSCFLIQNICSTDIDVFLLEPIGCFVSTF